MDILHYFDSNPDARDTVEGILEWWLLELDIRRSQAQVQKALAKLVEMGLVLGEKTTNSRIHYRVNPARRNEIQQLLKDAQS